jgi:hypothetical protein
MPMIATATIRSVITAMKSRENLPHVKINPFQPMRIRQQYHQLWKRFQMRIFTFSRK